MADNLPQPQSREQILSNSLSAYASKMGLNDLQVGSLLTGFFEVVSIVAARSSGDIFSVLRDNSIDRATGDILKRIATEENVPPITAQPATGYVTITDSSFQKISTKVYAGAASPNIGSTQILASDASAFPGTGSIYIGRGTPNVEGPLPYTAIIATGGHYSITLTSPTTKFHNVGETIVLSQGGVRTIGINTAPYAPASGDTVDVDFSVTIAAVILDGEISVTNVPVTAQDPGTDGNVPLGGIKLFTSDPFTGATVTNPLPFTNGTDSETDDELRVRIKRANASRGLGTASVVQGAVIGATSSDESGSITSSNILNDVDFANLYIDDGSGYEEKTTGVGTEVIIDSALGGEDFFQLATGGSQTQVAKAFLISSLSSPFDIKGGDTLSITVGEITYSHTFADSDFRSPGGATAYEMSAAINADTTLGFEATTSGGGTLLVISAIAETNDSLKTVVPTTSGRDVSIQLGFTSSTIETLRLYKNDIPLSKDGNAAIVFTQEQTDWSASIANGETLIVAVDNTSPITFTITDADFINTGLYNNASSSNSLESWIEVFNNKLTGLTASLVGTQIQLESNLGNNNRASVSIDPTSTLVTKGMFNSGLGLSSTGAASDFEFFRGTAQFKLTVPLSEGDRLSAGTVNTEAKIKSEELSGGSLTLTSDAHIWILTDQPGIVVNTGLTENSSISITKPSTNIVRYTSSVTSAFANVQLGDYVIIWSAELPSTCRFEGRVVAFTNTTLDLQVTSTEYAAATPVNNVVYKTGFVVLRSNYIPQKFTVVSGTSTLEQICALLNEQTNEVVFSVSLDEFLVVTSNTKDTSGQLLIVTSDTSGTNLLLDDKSTDTSKDSLIAFYDSGIQEASFPVFIHSKISNEQFADPITNYITTFDSAISLSARDPIELVRFLRPYGQSDDQAFNEYVQEQSLSGNTVNIMNEANLRRLRTVDRFFVASPLDFGPNDTAVVIADNDSESKSFEIPFFRIGTTNTSYANNAFSFNAYDTASGVSAQFASAFGSFDFTNFKVLMQAKKVLKATPPQTAILYRSVRSGRSGEKINVGYVYPSSANQSTNSVITVGSNVNINIVLDSATPIGTSIDPTTEWNVSITSNNPVAGVDQVTYTYSGTGTAPALSLSGGEYVNIGSKTELSPKNTGIFRVSTQSGFTPTSTSFSVQRPTGSAVAEMNKATQVNGQIAFYQSSPPTAAEIVAYVNANLTDYITASLVNDGGTSGSGLIAESTYEDTGFTASSVALLDGINWISSSNLSGNPQFTLKKALQLPSDVGYTFNNGEILSLVPTTMDQVMRLLNILAVTGFTTVGTVNVVDRGSRLEIATDTLGSLGAIQVVGGNANGYAAPILDTATRLDNTYSQISVGKVPASGAQSDQWYKLVATNNQKKLTLMSSNTSINVVGDSPTLNQSTVTLLGRTLSERYFGKPRHHIRSRSRTFKVEKQGSLVCLSWNGVGTSPFFQKVILNFNDTSGGTYNSAPIIGSSELEYTIESGNANFTELSINDLITIQNQPVGNNGTFLVTGVSDDGRTMRVLNVNGVGVYNTGNFTFTGNSTAGDVFSINGVNLTAGTSFPIGATQADTVINFTAIAGTVSGVTASASGSVVTITATTADSSITIAYTGTAVVTVSGPTLVGQAFAAGDFSASSQVSEGDNLEISSGFSILNQGKFRIIRMSNDSVWFENENAIEEEITLSPSLVTTGVNTTTSLKVNASNHTIYLNWNGTGTEPQLGNAQMGDILTPGTDFNSSNQGNFMVLRSGNALGQITSFVMPSGSQFLTSGVSKYFLINSGANVIQYYVWFNVNGATTDPAPVGLTGVQVNILNGDTDVSVAAKSAATLTTQTGLSASSSANMLIVTTTDKVETNTASNVTMPSPFTVTLVQAGRRTFLEAINPSAVSQSTVVPASGTFQVHRPQIQFSEYDATQVNDSFVVSGTTLGTSNNGSYIVVRVIDRDNIIVAKTMQSVTNISLNGKENTVYILEERPYIGYKQAILVATQPGSPTRSLITFNSTAQYEKIDDSSGVQLNSTNKMSFPTTLRLGLDSYRYDIGLIAEANRIIYGDPRDNITYPGVAASGAEIFIKGPLVKRISIGIVIRTLTGVPFPQTADQVRTVVSSLINSNPIGSPIAISAIVSVVNSVRGVRAVSISSPTYDDSNDLIPLTARQKALVVDPSVDVSVSLLE